MEYNRSVQGSHFPLEDRQARLSGAECGNIDACVKILDAPPNKNRNSDTKELRFLFFYDTIVLVTGNKRRENVLLCRIFCG